MSNVYELYQHEQFPLIEILIQSLIVMSTYITMLICNHYIDYFRTREKCLNANIPQIHYFKPKKEKDRKIMASFLSKSINIITTFALRKKSKTIC